MCSEEVQNTHAHKHINGENDQQPFGVIYFKIFSGTHQYMTWYDWLIGYVPGQRLSKYDVWFMIIHPILGILYAGYSCIFCIAINPYSLINGLITIPPYGDDQLFTSRTKWWHLRMPHLRQRWVVGSGEFSCPHETFLILWRCQELCLGDCGNTSKGYPSNGCCPAMFGRTSMNIANKSYTVYTVIINIMMYML